MHFILQDLIKLIDKLIGQLENYRYQEPNLSSDFKQKDEQHSTPKLTWTAKPTELVELSKALYLTGCFNEGNISYVDMISGLSKILKVEIKNVHPTYTKMQDRAGDRTIFLSKLKDAILSDMDKKDNK